MIKHALSIATLAVLISGCGGKKQATTTPDDETTEESPTSDSTDNSGSMVSPETMDEITRRFNRKGTAVSRCLAMAVDNKELPKNSRGKMTLDVVIGTSGKVDSVKIIKQTVQSKSLDECVLGHVREIEFPTVPKPYETTYTYAFEAV